MTAEAEILTFCPESRPGILRFPLYLVLLDHPCLVNTHHFTPHCTAQFVAQDFC